MAAPTALKRYGKSNFEAMLVRDVMAFGWSEPTRIQRWEEKNGTNTVFTIQAGAIEAFKDCKEGSVFKFEVEGRCVKVCDAMAKYGFANKQEVLLKKPTKVTASEVEWPRAGSYSADAWSDLREKKAGSFTDLVGFALAEPEMDPNSPIAKACLALGSGSSTETIELLGTDASLPIQEGDVVAFSGLKVKEYRFERSLQTVYTTRIEVNPSKRQGLPQPDEAEDDQPPTKVMKMTKQTLKNVKDVLQLLANQQNADPDSQGEWTENFDMQGKLDKLTLAFFESDPPIVGEKSLVCLPSSLTDSTGTVSVKLWGKPCSALLQDNLIELWEKGLEEPQKQDEILTRLNAHLGKTVRVSCTAKLWSQGYKNKTTQMQINVNLLELVESSGVSGATAPPSTGSV